MIAIYWGMMRSSSSCGIAPDIFRSLCCKCLNQAHHIQTCPSLHSIRPTNTDNATATSGSSSNGRRASSAVVCPFECRIIIPFSKCKSRARAEGSLSSHGLRIRRPQNPSVSSRRQNGCTFKKFSSPLRSSMLEYKGVPDTIHRLSALRLAMRRASSVAELLSSCISSTTTRRQRKEKSLPRTLQHAVRCQHHIMRAHVQAPPGGPLVRPQV